MNIYIAHEYGGKNKNLKKAKKIAHDLQVNDLDNLYVSPLLNFSHLKYCEIGYDDEMELCYDLMSCCDKLYVASRLSEGVINEIKFAKKIGMPIVYIGEGKKYEKQGKDIRCDL